MTNFKYIFFILSLSLIVGCGSSVDNTIRITKEVDFKVQSLIHKKVEKCKKNALEDAEIYVDSIISEITQNSFNKGIEFPDKPEKKDTDSLSFKIEIDSMDLNVIADSLKMIRDTTQDNE